MRTTNQKIVFSWILYFTDIFTKSQRQKRPAAGGESCKAGFFLVHYNRNLHFIPGIPNFIRKENGKYQ